MIRIALTSRECLPAIFASSSRLIGAKMTNLKRPTDGWLKFWTPVKTHNLAMQYGPHWGKNPESFPLIYFISTPIKIYIKTDNMPSVLSATGKDYGGSPKGFMNLKQQNITHAMKRFGSVDGLMSHVLGVYGEEDPPEEDYPSLLEQLRSPEIKVDFVDDLLKVRQPKTKTSGKIVPQRRSKQSKVVGDTAELYIVELLRNNKIPSVRATQVEHVADQKVGWDIQYKNELGDLVFVEVKGSTAPRFGNFEITVNELNALQQHKQNYHFYLVGSCMSSNRKVQVIVDMAKRLTDKRAATSPLTFRVELQS